MEHGFVPHRVEHAFQELEELTAPLRHDLKLDEICHWHRSAPWIEIGFSPICNAPRGTQQSMPAGIKKRLRRPDTLDLGDQISNAGKRTMPAFYRVSPPNNYLAGRLFGIT
jgi:hypothetical protein